MLLESDRALSKKQQELKIAKEAILGAQQSALAKSKETRQYRAQLENAWRRLRFAQDSYGTVQKEALGAHSFLRNALEERSCLEL